MESLGYMLLELLCGDLPWDERLATALKKKTKLKKLDAWGLADQTRNDIYKQTKLELWEACRDSENQDGFATALRTMGYSEKVIECIPSAYGDYFRHVRNLEFADTPDYEYLKALFEPLTQCDKLSLKSFDWDSDSDSAIPQMLTSPTNKHRLTARPVVAQPKKSDHVHLQPPGRERPRMEDTFRAESSSYFSMATEFVTSLWACNAIS